MMTQLVNLDPLPTLVFFPTMHRFIATFSPRFGYTLKCRCESGEIHTPDGVFVGAGLGGRSFRACDRYDGQFD